MCGYKIYYIWYINIIHYVQLIPWGGAYVYLRGMGIG